MSEEIKKEDKFIVKISCELEDDTVDRIARQIYTRIEELKAEDFISILKDNINVIHELDESLLNLKKVTE